MDTNLKHKLMRYMAGNFSCQEIAQLITDYLDGSLTLSERVRFQLHLGLCFACRNYLGQMKYTIATLRQLPPEPVPQQVKEELLERFRTWKQRHPQPSVKSETE
ncbi:MAG: zf-HC2 domain-containing protein [Nitrospira sp.]|nr:zf-HC2 domain-containing protein [Nitrospira sp.]HBP87437.1 anti-sigma factor [Nitrospiraceae bacterium]HNP30844.1 zf-HC2 domain-containing protein [Nitrospirales bacterium]